MEESANAVLDDGIGSWVQRRRVKSRDKDALVWSEGSRSYGELANRIDSLAASLRASGVTKGDRVGYLGENSPEFIEALFATCRAGAIFVPINTRLATPEVEFIVGDSGCSVLFFGEAFHSLVEEATNDFAALIRVQVGGEELHGQRPAQWSYEQLLGAATGVEWRDQQVTLDDSAVILYTSGTTGKPKGALLSHGNLTWNSFNVLVDYDLSSSDVALMISPLFHAASLGMGALPTILKGATLLLQRRFEPGAVLSAIKRHGVTWLSGVPTTYQLIAEDPAWEETDLTSLRSLTCGGSPVPTRVTQAYESRGLAFTGGYGLSECAPGVTSLQAEHSRDRAASAGLPHFFTHVRLMDANGAIPGPGEVGEILVKGPNVIREYWRRPELAAELAENDGWFRTGDVAYTDDDGFIFISDRLKDMIISGGENIYPAEIEQLIMEIGGVQSVAIIGVADPKWNEVGRAIVQLKPGVFIDPSVITDHLSGRIAKYKVPKSVVFVGEMPRTASGKIKKPDLRRLYGSP